MNITNITLGQRYADKQAMMNELAQENFCAEKVLADCDPRLIATADPMALSVIDAKVKNGSDLSFEEAFSGMLLTVSATNNLLRGQIFPKMSLPEAVAKGTGFLQLMAVKESLYRLVPEEIAGMSAAGMLDIVFRPSIPEVVETCGMGGDRGWGTKDVKTINASTLSSVVLASLGIPSFKHGSYGNTTKIGSTDVPIGFGAEICLCSSEQIFNVLEETNFWFSDAHSVKTVHYLSHLLMIETVNHIIGPMTPPVAKNTKLYKVIGVNHNVHPEIIARTYTILHQRGFINLGGVIVVSGLDKIPKHDEHQDECWVKKHSFLDEISPKVTLVSLAKRDKFLGNFLLTDENFAATPLYEEGLKVPNTQRALMRADERALTGKDKNLSDYLARNAALGLLISNGLSEEQPFATLPDCYQRCLYAIHSRQAIQTLKDYAKASGGKFRTWLFDRKAE